MQFLAFMKFGRDRRNTFDASDFLKYRAKIEKVTRRIDKWHAKMTKHEIFENDTEYQFVKQSPNHFSGDSDSDIEREDLDSGLQVQKTDTLTRQWRKTMGHKPQTNSRSNSRRMSHGVA